MLVELNHVCKQYKGFSLDCSLSLAPGCITGLIGANGAGKTTAFKTILGLVYPDSGDVRVLGKHLEDITPKDKRKIGVVLSGSGFNGYLNVQQIMRIMGGFYENFDQDWFAEKCRHFSIPMDKKLKDFSTGMKAKLKVLLSMSYHAVLLILDEPTAGLDVLARDELLEMLREYMETEGRAILISSHISSDLEGLCDDLYMIHKGSIVLHEDTDVLMDSYGLLKVREKEYPSMDKSHILRVKKEHFGYSCLTNEKNYYMENYPGLIVEKGSIDEVITMMARGKAV